MNMQASQWRAIALAEEVTGGKPLGVVFNGEPIVLFRNQDGVVRALENRCPHRRVPLSLGKVRPDGLLQCGYHGWSFDGETGKCGLIPNLRADEKVPATYGVFPYRAAERHNMVYISVGGDVAALPEANIPSGTRDFSGRVMIGLSPDDYIEALMDGPDLLLDCAGMRISRTMAADPHERDGMLVMERAAYWFGQSSFDGFVREYGLLFRLAVQPGTGEIWASFLRPDGVMLAGAHMAISSARRGVSAVLWRSFVSPASGPRAALLGLAARLGRAPIAPRQAIDMAAVADLLAGPSEYWERGTQDEGLYGDVVMKERARI